MPKSVGSPQITLRYRPTDPLGELLASLPEGANKTDAVNAALGWLGNLKEIRAEHERMQRLLEDVNRIEGNNQ